MAHPHVNAIVIGAGAGGGVVAQELSEAGLSVVLFERGDWIGFNVHDHDELINQRVNVLGNGFGPDAGQPRVVVAPDGSTQVVEADQPGYGNNAACVGSGTVSYGGMAWRYMEQDFRMRSVYGAPENSSLEDWPISYADLESCYERAEWEIGVAGDMSGNPHSPPRRRDYPMPPFAYNREGSVLRDAAQRMGLNPFPIPMLRNTVPYGGRNACIACRYCVGFACEINAKNGTQNTAIPRALATGLCELRTGCIVSKIHVDDQGRARGIRYFDRQHRAQEQSADLVVLAGGAIESARLLLNSKSKLFPTGAGNRNDLVGRNLQGHAYFNSMGTFDDEVYDDIGSGATVAISDYNHGNPGHIGGAVLTNEFIRLPYLFSRAGHHPPGAPRWGQAHKDFQRDYYKRTIKVAGPVQEIPRASCRVEVDPTVTDQWGIPVARLSGTKHPLDIETMRYVATKAEAWLRAAGAREVWSNVPPSGARLAQHGGQHQAGTCRMGDDPATSVTNRHGQLHEIDNLFVADGGLHVTNGGFNPVLTIFALAYWVSDHIKDAWKGGGLR